MLIWYTTMGNISDAIARNLRQPESGIIGYYVKRRLKEGNRDVELTAVKLSEIEPHHTVLEVGFGPGIGVRAAYECIKGGTGKVYGIEISEAMLHETQSEMQDEIKEGRVALTLGSVNSMPYSDNQFDCVFHCNVYYFWDDLEKAACEMYRVMKPGARMVTTLKPAAVKAGEVKGTLRYGKGDSAPFLDALRSAGFVDVNIGPVKDAPEGTEAIFAYVANLKKESFDLRLKPKEGFN